MALTPTVLPPAPPAAGVVYIFSPPVPLDIGVADLLAPTVPFAPGLHTPQFKVSNYGLNNITFFRLAFRLNNTLYGPRDFSISIPSGGDATVSWPTALNFTPGVNTIVAWTILPNRGIDGNRSNDTLEVNVRTALNGVYTINNTQPSAYYTAQPTNGNFLSFTDAITALNEGGTTGPVTFLVSNGQTFNEDVPAITRGGTAANPILFREATLTPTDLSDNPVIQPTGTAAANDAGLTVTAVDYLAFDGISIGANGNSTAVEYGYLVRNTATNGATNISIRNTRIALSRANANAVGVLQTSGPLGGGVLATAASGINANNQFHNLTITNVNKGIYLLCGNTTGSNYDDNTQVYNNILGADLAAVPTGDIGTSATALQVGAGIQATRQSNVRIYGNEVRNVAVSGAEGYGLWVEAALGTGLVYNNQVHDISHSSATGTDAVYGIRLDVAASGTGHALRAYNNFVYNISHAFTGTATDARRVYGIATQAAGGGSGSSLLVAYNSVRLETPSTYTASSVAFAALPATGGPELMLRNNIFANLSETQTGAAKHYAIESSSATALGGNAASTSNYNDLFVQNGNGLVGRAGTTEAATLADWRLTGFAIRPDANSVSLLPRFFSPTNLHLLGNSPLNNLGTPISGVVTDIDGATRDMTQPDIGADEFAPVGNDISVTALLTPPVGTTCYSATEVVTVQITNAGLATLDFVANPATVTVRVTLPDGSMQTLTTTISSGTLAAGATLAVTLPGTLAMTATGTYSFVLMATTVGDQNTGNDILTPAVIRTVNAPVAGTLTPAVNTICNSGSVTFTLTGAQYGTVQFQRSLDNVTFTDIAGATANTFTTPVLTQTTYYRAQVRCNSNLATSNVATVTVNTPAASTTNSPVNSCQGSTATLTVTAPVGTTLQFFTAATGGTALAGSTTTGTTTSFVTPALTASTQYFVQGSIRGSETVGPVAPTNTASTAIISNSGLLFTASANFVLASVDIYPTGGGGNLNIRVIDNANSVVVSTIGRSLDTTVVVPGGNGTTLFRVPLRFRIPGGSSAAAMRLVALSGPPLATGPVAGSSPFPTPYTAPSGVVSITSGYTNSGNSPTYFYFYNWQIPTLCTGATRTPIQVNVDVPPTASLSSPGATCGASPYQLTGTFGGSATGLVYSSTGTGTFSPDATTPTATYTPSAADVAAGSVTLTLRTTGGTCAPATRSIVLTINPATTATFSYSGSPFCRTTTTAVAPAITGTGGGTFSVTPTSGLTLNASTGAITPSTSTAGTYTVRYEVGGSCTSNSSQTVVITNAPVADFTYPTPTPGGACAGTTGTIVATLSMGATAGTFSATPGTGLALDASTGAVDLSASTAGTYTITNNVAASGSCTSVSSSQTLVVNATPAAPTITAAYGSTTATLTSSAASGNQWYLNGTAVPGATGQTYTVNAPAQVGSYTVVTTNAAGCASAFSAPLVVTGSRSALAGSQLSVYPNPTVDGRLTLELVGYRQAADLLVLNVLGQLVHAQRVPAGSATSRQVQVDLTGLPTGVYTLRLTSQGAVATQKVIRK